jgi:hypothetical protein
MTTLKLVDDCGHQWNCLLVFVSFPYKHFKLGGEWKRFVAASRLNVGDHIQVRRQVGGNDGNLYLTVYR